MLLGERSMGLVAPPFTPVDAQLSIIIEHLRAINRSCQTVSDFSRKVWQYAKKMKETRGGKKMEETRYQNYHAFINSFSRI